MPLEIGSFISDLNASNPGASDGLGQGDDHIRLIKSAIKNTFTAMNGATDVVPGTLNDLEDGIFEFADGALTAPALRSATEPTLGIHRVAAGKLGLSQGKRFVGNGLVPVGSMHSFPKVPSSGFSSGGVATENPERIAYLEADGSIYNIADFPDLGDEYGNTFGGNGVSTFGVPNLKDTGRFLRSRTNALAVGTPQANVFKTHIHTVTVDAGGNHDHGGTLTATSNGAHRHFVSSAVVNGFNNPLTADNQLYLQIDPGNANAYFLQGTATDATVGRTSEGGAHTHSVPIPGSGTHAHTGTIGATGDATETRPEAFVAVICVKT